MTEPMSAPNGSTPLVTVVVATWNRRALLQETLASVFAQTFEDFEVIVIDDGSSDETQSYLESSAIDRRLRYVRQPHSGPSIARRRGLEEARAELITFLDDDDLWPTDKLQWQVDAMREHPDVSLVYGFMDSFGTERPFRWPPPDGPTGRVLDAFLTKNWIRSPGQALMRSSAVRDVGGWDGRLWSADDWDLYLKLAAAGPFLYCHRHALSYRAHDNNLSKRAWRLYRNSVRVHRRHAGALPTPRTAKRWLRCRLSMANTLRNELRAWFRAELSKRGWRRSDWA